MSHMAKPKNDAAGKQQQQQRLRDAFDLGVPVAKYLQAHPDMFGVPTGEELRILKAIADGEITLVNSPEEETGFKKGDQEKRAMYRRVHEACMKDDKQLAAEMWDPRDYWCRFAAKASEHETNLRKKLKRRGRGKKG